MPVPIAVIRVSDFLVVEDLVELGLLAVDQLAAERQDCLVTAVATLLGGAAGGIALDDIQLGQGGVALGAVRELARQPAAGERALADGLARLARGLAGAGGVEALVDDPAGNGGVFLQEEFEFLADDLLDDAVDLRVGELGLGLALEARLRQLDGDDRDQALAHVIPGDAGILLLEQVVGLGEIVDDAGERGAEAREVRAALEVEDRIGVGEDLVVVRIVVLHRHVDDGARLRRILVGHGVAECDGLVVQDDLVGVEETHELGDAVLEHEPLVLPGALVSQVDEHARVEERQFAQAVGKDLVLELPGDLENLGIGFEGDLRAGLSGLPLHRHLLDRLALRKTHVVDLPVPAHLGLEPFGNGIHTFRADPMQAA